MAPAYPIGGDIVVNEQFLNGIDAHFTSQPAELQSRKSDIEVAKAAEPVVRTGSKEFAEGAVLAQRIGAVLGNLAKSYDDMESRINTIIGGVRYLRSETENAEEIAKMTAADL